MQMGFNASKPSVIFGSTNQVILSRLSNNVIGLVDLTHGIATGSGATANRPANPTPGTLWLDTTLNTIIAWNGTNWKAAGATV